MSTRRIVFTGALLLLLQLSLDLAPSLRQRFPRLGGDTLFGAGQLVDSWRKNSQFLVMNLRIEARLRWGRAMVMAAVGFFF